MNYRYETMKKVFNLKKWQDLQERREDLFDKYNKFNDSFREAKNDYFRQLSWFLGLYDSKKDKTLENAIAIDRKLTHQKLCNRALLMQKNWAAVCSDFGLKHDTPIKSEINYLYTLMIHLKKQEEMNEKISIDIKNHGACQNVLEEFASRHLKMNNSGPTATQDRGPSHAQAASYPLA